MKSIFFNKKGLTFKGAFVVVIFLHVFAYAFIKYQSHVAKTYREKWKANIAQRSTDLEWSSHNKKPRIVAKAPPLKVAASTQRETPFSTFKQRIDDTINVITKETSQTKQTFKSFINSIQQIQIPLNSKKLNKDELKLSFNEKLLPSIKPERHRPPENKTSDKETRLLKLLEMDKLKKQLRGVSETPKPKERSVPPPRPISTPTTQTVIQSRSFTVVPGKVKQLIEFDETTREVIHTFY